MTDTTWNEDAQRYELRVDGDLAGFIETERDGDVLALTHTELLESYQGKGLSKPLISAALEDAIEKNLTVAPICGAVAAYVERHDVPGLQLVDKQG
ncbi:GNAT family N-acetyltransferase [Demequina sp. NBRC 110053]|uniref:GNAT family N-acetyltransferase n=1 Tax=Demequina sp. NBRC 110053 TaxID=1570342 RepID=UPI000A04F03A|nr:GNAT family N-acetyltransferase [Demequina sp. NBRC 110053]